MSNQPTNQTEGQASTSSSFVLLEEEEQEEEEEEEEEEESQEEMAMFLKFIGERESDTVLHEDLMFS